MLITKTEIETARKTIEDLKDKLNRQFFKMEEATEEGSDPTLFARFVAAHDIVSEAADVLSEAINCLRDD